MCRSASPPWGLLAEALATARAVADEPSHTEARGSLALHLLEGLLPDALAAARAVADEIEDEDDRAAALTALALHLAALPALLRYRCLAETLPLLARRPRLQLPGDLGALLLLIAAIGSADATGEMF
ncbi:MAG: hypothetical protein RMJ48_21775 [Roseiflexaceae bacterium]|nr:hypothetical protein [Roseiflexaceae bacterium]